VGDIPISGRQEPAGSLFRAHPSAAIEQDRSVAGDAPEAAAVQDRAKWHGTAPGIATMVREGASNREIAARMFLSVKTVEATLTRIYRKLEVRSRAELAHRLRAKS